MFPQDFKAFIELLNKYAVQYLIVGGYAVGIHGSPRYTGDLDIWLLANPQNASNALAAIREFGFNSLDITQEDLSREGIMIQLGYPPLRIDLLTSIDGVEFSACYQNRKLIKVDELEVNFIGLNDLITNKKASGRHQDLGDVENLQ